MKSALNSLSTILLATVSGCASTTTIHVPVGMKVATSEMVASCRLVGDVHGVSSLYGVFAESALANARRQAFEQARLLGANTVVWGPFSTPYGSTSVSGNAYFCSPQRPETAAPGSANN